jgi:Predicted choline kinase involved in LPS biosynthesis
MNVGRHPVFILRRISASHDVFVLTDNRSDSEFILKSFARRHARASSLERYMDNEYDSLKRAGEIGIGSHHWRVVRPVCRDRKALFFVEEKAEGVSLDRHMHRELAGGVGRLDEKLDLLAGFFARLHRKTSTGQHVNASSMRKELDRHVVQSWQAGGLSHRDMREALSLSLKWCGSSAIRHATSSLTHGDATPANFICDGDRLFVIDLERSKYRDPAYDLGMMAGELFAAALSARSNPYDADPYIGRLYRKYAGNFNDWNGTFSRLTARNPLYMANSLLRMSRNGYFLLSIAAGSDLCAGMPA